MKLENRIKCIIEIIKEIQSLSDELADEIIDVDEILTKKVPQCNDEQYYATYIESELDSIVEDNNVIGAVIDSMINASKRLEFRIKE